ncbi:DUF1707 and DUF4870 domain-containing protein [Flindersiella endophytica]
MNAGTGHTPTATSPMPGPGPVGPGALRVGHAERDQTVELLQNAFAEGRLNHEELDRRIEDALSARNRADLAEVLRGLPVSHPYQAAVAPMAPRPPHAMPNGEDRLLSLVAHWSGLFTLFVGPAIIAYTAGKNSRFVREQALEATNFQLTFLGAIIALGIVTGVTLGVAGVLFPLLVGAWFILMGIGGLSAAAGNRWRYPKSLRLLS